MEEQMDHHCPWVNNCVGIGNHKFFIQFISYVFAISMYALVLVFIRFVTCVAEPHGCQEASTNLFVVLLVLEVRGEHGEWLSLVGWARILFSGRGLRDAHKRSHDHVCN